ncbi:MAG: hypothetical protein AB8B55_18390 [Mariniblastus sp.]
MTYSPQPTKPRRGGGGMFFLIIIGVVGFVIFSNMGKAQRGPVDIGGTQVEQEDKYKTELPSDLRGGGDFEPAETAKSESKKMPTTGGSGRSSDWSIDDVDGDKPKTGTQANGDWAIEDVDPKKKDNQFQFSNEAKGKPGANTSGGDWSIDDAGSKQNSKPSKTQNGDWSIEDADPKKKK